MLKDSMEYIWEIQGPSDFRKNEHSYMLISKGCGALLKLKQVGKFHFLKIFITLSNIGFGNSVSYNREILEIHEVCQNYIKNNEVCLVKGLLLSILHILSDRVSILHG